MAIQVASSIVLKNGSKGPVVDDIYIRGGFRVVADVAARNALYSNATARNTLKLGALALTLADLKLWYYASVNTWVEYKPQQMFSFRQEAPQAEWAINHGKNCSRLTYSLFSLDGYQMWPDTCRIVDNDNLVLSFLEPVAGEITIAFNI